VRDARTAGAGLIAAMEELSPLMVVMAVTERGGIRSALLGTTIERVLHAASCPVAVVPRGYRRPEQGVQLIGVAYTPTPEGIEALRAGAMLARNASVRLRAITELDPKHAEDQAPGIMAQQHRDTAPEVDAEARERMDEQSGLRGALANFAGDLDAETDVLYNDPAEGLVAASRHVDLLVMGSRARGARRSTVLGSVSRKVAEQCACPVVILPLGAKDTTSDLFSRAGTADA
jgi:nucleotide-binding universal stress UspA family protein